MTQDDVDKVKALYVVLSGAMSSEEIKPFGLAIEAMQKQVPTAPIAVPFYRYRAREDREFDGFALYCPDCRHPIDYSDHHCRCGQTIDWGDYE